MMSELEQYLDTIEAYAMVGDWDAESYDEAVAMFLDKVFGEVIKENIILSELDF